MTTRASHVTDTPFFRRGVMSLVTKADNGNVNFKEVEMTTKTKMAGTGETSWRQLFSVHPCADVFPMMDDAEIDALAEDIKANGLQQPILFLRSRKKKQITVLDGRNRLEAL